MVSISLHRPPDSEKPDKIEEMLPWDTVELESTESIQEVEVMPEVLITIESCLTNSKLIFNIVIQDTSERLV